MKIELSGKTALVTGSSSGIGYAIARGLAEAGAAVVVHGRAQERIDAACRRLTAEVPGATVRGQAADLADAAGVRQLLDAVPRVDILVNNAGAIPSGPFLEMTDDEWQRYQDVYVTAAARLARHYLPEMLRADWGRILCSAGVTCSHTPGDRDAAARMIAWLTSKAALLGLARGLAELAAGTRVTVNSFLPGPAPTEEAYAAWKQEVPFERFAADYFAGPGMASVVRRFLDPREVANLVVFLASDAASGITGAALRVDGGILRTIV